MDKDDREQERALFRYGLVAPVLHRDLERGEQAAILREQADQEWEVPGGGRHRFSERTLRRYLKKRRDKGLDGLRRQPRADARARKRLSDAAWQRAQELRREQPRRSAEVILRILVHEKLLAPGGCSPATLRRHLHAAGLSREQLLKDRPRAYRRWQRREPGALWQFDATGGLWLPDPDGGSPRQLWIIAGKDDASRLLVGGRAYFHAHQAALDDLCKRAFRRWGIPRAIYVDRGAIFVSGHFRRVIAEVGSELIHATAYYAEGKGKIESAMALLKDAFYPEVEGDVAAGRVTAIEQVNAYLEAFLHYVNHRRHRETKRIPADVYGADPRNPYPDPLGLDELFLWRKTVPVDKFGTAPLEGNRYAVGGDLRGQKVQLRYDPFDLRRAQLWVGGRLRGEVEPEALVERVAEPVRSDPQPPSAATATSFLAQLWSEYDAELRRAAEDIPFRQAPAAAGPQLGALVTRIEDLLGRALRPAEQHQLHDAWRARGPLAADLAADRLRPFTAPRSPRGLLQLLCHALGLDPAWFAVELQRRSAMPALYRRGAGRRPVPLRTPGRGSGPPPLSSSSSMVSACSPAIRGAASPPPCGPWSPPASQLPTSSSTTPGPHRPSHRHHRHPGAALGGSLMFTGLDTA